MKKTASELRAAARAANELAFRVETGAVKDGRVRAVLGANYVAEVVESLRQALLDTPDPRRIPSQMGRGSGASGRRPR